MPCCLELQHSHSQAYGPVAEQVDCRVQLQHRSTSSWTRLLVGRLTVEPKPNPSIGVSPFLFCLPNDPDAIGYTDTTPAIARPYLLISDISAESLNGSSHRSHTAVVPLRDGGYTVTTLWCVCNIHLFDFYCTQHYFQFQRTPSSQPLLDPRYTPTPISPLLYANNLSAPFLSH